MTLDQLYPQYLSDPTKLDSLLRRVTSYATSIARNMRHSDPEDIGQRATIKVWQQWTSFDGSGSFAGWVSRITRNLVIDGYRGDDPVEQMDDDTSEPACLPPTWNAERNFESLTGDIGKIAAMLSMGYSRQETADALRCSVRTLERIVERHASTLEPA